MRQPSTGQNILKIFKASNVVPLSFWKIVVSFGAFMVKPISFVFVPSWWTTTWVVRFFRIMIEIGSVVKPDKKA